METEKKNDREGINNILRKRLTHEEGKCQATGVELQRKVDQNEREWRVDAMCGRRLHKKKKRKEAEEGDGDYSEQGRWKFHLSTSCDSRQKTKYLCVLLDATLIIYWLCDNTSHFLIFLAPKNHTRREPVAKSAGNKGPINFSLHLLKTCRAATVFPFSTSKLFVTGCFSCHLAIAFVRILESQRAGQNEVVNCSKNSNIEYVIRHQDLELYIQQ